MLVIGIENVDYVSKKTQQHVVGRKLYLEDTVPIEDSKGSGYRVYTEYCKSGVADDICLGDEVTIYYNRYGSIVDVVARR